MSRVAVPGLDRDVDDGEIVGGHALGQTEPAVASDRAERVHITNVVVNDPQLEVVGSGIGQRREVDLDETAFVGSQETCVGGCASSDRKSLVGHHCRSNFSQRTVVIGHVDNCNHSPDE